MTRVGRLDTPFYSSHNHSTLAPSKDFSHELTETDDEHEALDRMQDASVSRSSEKAKAGRANGSVPMGGGEDNNNQSSHGSTATHVSPMLSVDSAAAIQQPMNFGVLAFPNSPQKLVVNETALPSQMAVQSGSYEAKSSALSLSNDDRDLFSTIGLIAMQNESGEVVQPTGITEALLGSRIYGEHMLAEPYLSEIVQVSSSAIAQGKDIADSAVSVPLATKPVVEINPLSVERGEELATPQQEEITFALALLADGNESVSFGSPKAGGALSAASAEAATAFWPESSVRLTKQRDGSAVIWLRDYRADSDDAAKLVEAIVKGASARGMRLGRVVLNGREVWASQNNH